MDKKKIVILGAGFGGLRTALDVARGLKNLDLLEKYEVVLIDRENCHLFIPILYKVAARPEPEHEAHCSYDITDLIEGLPITFIQAEITSPDIIGGVITLKDGRTIRGDYIVIALGSETNYFNIPGLQEHALQLKTLDSAKQIRAAVKTAFERGGNIRIVTGGGGPNGIELAAEIRQWANHEQKKHPGLHVSVSIVEAMPTILPGFDPQILKIAMKRLARMKVAVLTGMKITSASDHALTIEGKEDIPFDVLIWTGGTRMPQILDGNPLEKEARGKPLSKHGMMCLPAAEDLTLAAHIYAVGDNVCFYNPKTQKPVPAVAHAAIMEGAVAAHNLLEEIKKSETAAYVPALVNYSPDFYTYAYVIPIGEHWAVAKMGPFIMYGVLGWELARFIELNYLRMIMPLGRALRTWQRM